MSPLQRGILLLLVCAATAGTTVAQTFELAFNETPLSEALTAFSDSSDTDVVYSSNLLRGRSTSCSYTGDDPRAALHCIMVGHPFRVQQVSRTQYVLVPLVDSDSASGGRRRVVFSGFVSDASSGESLIGAHVMLPGLSAGAVTNDAGYFALPGVAPGRLRVRVSFLGFTTVDTLLTVDEHAARFRLHPSTTSVGGPVVEDDSNVRIDRGLTPGVVSIPVSSLGDLPASLGGKDVFEELRWMPGIERAGEATGGLIVRGSGSDQNLYLIDGAPLYHPWHAFSLVSTFQTETFKDVTLYRGAFPAEYGGRLSAVLDAELRDGGRRGPRMVGAISALNARFLVESPINQRTSFMVAGRRSYVDKLIGRRHAVSDDLGRRDTLRTGYYFYDWSAKFTYRPNTRSSISASYYTGRDVLDLRLPFDLSLDFSSWLRPADLFFEVDQHWGNRLFSVQHQLLLSDKFFLTTTGYDTRYSAQEASLVRPTHTASVISEYAVDVNDLGVRADLDYYQSMRHHVRLGFAAIRHRFRSTLDATVNYAPGVRELVDQNSRLTAVEFAGYVQDHWRPTSRWRLLPGIRLSYFDHGNYLRISPRMSSRFAVSPGKLYLMVSAASQVQYMQRIRDRHSFLYDLVSSRWIPADAATAPSRSAQLTSGLEMIPVPGIRVTFDVYKRRGRNILLPRDEFQSKDGLLGPGIEISTLLAQYAPGRERSRGYEIGLDMSRGSWRIVSSFTASRSKSNLEETDGEEFRPTRFDTPFVSSLVVQRQKGPWTMGLSGIWRSGYPVSVPTARYTLEDPITGDETAYFYRPKINNGRLPPYTRLDLHFAYAFRLADARWTASIHLYNVLNHRNVVGRSFDPSKSIVTPKDRLGLPILPLFDIQMNL